MELKATIFRWLSEVMTAFGAGLPWAVLLAACRPPARRDLCHRSDYREMLTNRTTPLTCTRLSKCSKFCVFAQHQPLAVTVLLTQCQHTFQVDLPVLVLSMLYISKQDLSSVVSDARLPPLIFDCSGCDTGCSASLNTDLYRRRERAQSCPFVVLEVHQGHGRNSLADSGSDQYAESRQADRLHASRLARV